MLFPKLLVKKEDIIKDHPKHHPASQEYLMYWREQKRRCIEGFWVKDGTSGYRFVPGHLYFYANIAHITAVDSKTKTTVIKRPSIDDVEWIIFTVLLVCRGFSGFDEDLEFTCNKLYEGQPNYVDPWEYLKRTHAKPLGKPLYENQCLNLLLLSSRGIGKTFTIVNEVTAELLLDGAKEYNQLTIENPAKISIFVGAYKSDKSENMLNQMDITINNLPGGSPSPFFKELTGVNKAGYVRKHEYKVKEGGNWSVKGSGSQIIHEVVSINNPQAAAAYRATLAVIEEIGLLEANIEEVLGATEPVLSVGDVKFGSFIGLGTGGDVNKVAQLEKIFRRPDEYKFFSMDDIFENMGRIGLFIPAQYMYRSFKDEYGNTDWDKATKTILNERKNKQYTALEQTKMNYPIVPSEIFMSNRQSIFPITELKQQLKWLIHNESKLSISYGDLMYTDNGIKFVENKVNEPLNKYPIEKGKSLKGCLTIYEHPSEYIPDGLYKIVYDPFRDFNIDRMDRGVSCGAIYVYKGYDKTEHYADMLVAQYVGRTQNPDDVHELALKLALYYNAKIMPEMDLPGFFKYCLTTKRLSLLAPTPWTTIGKFNSSTKRRYSYGIMMKGNKALALQSEQYLSRWLLTERSREYDENGNIVKVRTNINYIYDRALLEELISYNELGNFDRISALKLLMIWLEESTERKEIIELKQEENKFEVFVNTHIYG